MIFSIGIQAFSPLNKKISNQFPKLKILVHYPGRGAANWGCMFFGATADRKDFANIEKQLVDEYGLPITELNDHESNIITETLKPNKF